MPRVLRVDPAHPAPALAEAAAVLRAGGLVAFPTETVYGLGADATSPAAVAKIFVAKGRPADNPLIVHVPDRAAARACADRWPELADAFARAFWPGPLTLVVPRAARIPESVSAGLPAVGLRMPAHPVALGLLQETGLPIAAPSANPYTTISPTTAAHVAAGLGERVDLILDGGPSEVGIESTVLDLTGEVPVVLRPGGISLEELQAIAPATRLAGHVVAEGPRVSPGLARRHYAPRIPLVLVPDRAMLEAQLAADPASVGLALGAATSPRMRPMPADPRGYAAALYAMLHELEGSGASRIVVEAPPAEPAWEAVRDRLARAAHP